MVNLNPLDALDTLDSYRHLFMDARFWQPYVRQVCARHSLSCSTIRAGTPGTFPVFIVDDRASHRASHCASHPYFWESPRSPEGPYFGESPRSFALRIALRIPILGKAPVPQRVPILGTEGPDFGDRWVVKFFGRLFDGARAAAAERAVGRLLALHPVAPCATLVAEGRLLAESSSGWDWPYLVFQFLDGTSFGENFGVLLKAEKMGVARQMGTWVRALHNLPLPQAGPFETNWSGFERFLAGQWTGCAARQAAWGSLPPLLVAQIDAFLPPLSALLDKSIRPHLIHADLTADHLLGQVADGRWRSLGLIDFGDARTGNLEYELAALHLDLFHCDRQMLAAFFSSYKFTPPADFPRRALAYCLLHQFDLFAPFAGQIRATRLVDLADELWSVESGAGLGPAQSASYP